MIVGRGKAVYKEAMIILVCLVFFYVLLFIYEWGEKARYVETERNGE